MNKMINMTVIALCAAMAATTVSAQTALQQLKLQAGEQALAETSKLQIPHPAVQEGGQLVSVPMNAQDVFAQCQAVDAKAMSLVAWTLPQAVAVMQNCLNKAYTQGPNVRRIYSVTAVAARFGVPMCPQVAGRMGCMGITEVEGIKITVAGRILTGDSVLMDLGYSLKKRDGKLLGFHAILDDQAVILH